MPNKLGRPGFDYRQIIGKRFGRLLVLELLPKASADRQLALCRCDCGNTCQPQAKSLRAGLTRSYKCLYFETARKTGLRAVRHGHWAGESSGGSRTYRTWCGMKSRCHNPNATSYSEYGGRGISVTKPWRDSFESFLNDMGERPEGKTLDRIDGRFGYFMANCRWATARQQAQNRKKRAVVCR